MGWFASMHAKTVLKSGLSVWVLNFVINVVTVLALIAVAVAAGTFTLSPVVFGAVSVVATFSISTWLLPKLCSWQQDKQTAASR